MSVSTFLLLLGLAILTVGQVPPSTPSPSSGTYYNYGGLYNGLRYSFSYGTGNVGSGCNGGNRPNLPTYPGALSGYGQLCFFMHELHYIYSTDCANTIYDKYVWMGRNSTLPGSYGGTSGVGTGNGDYYGYSNHRYISDGTWKNLTYSYDCSNNYGYGGNTNGLGCSGYGTGTGTGTGNGNNNGYNYGYGYNYNNNYFVLTTAEDFSAITSFSYYSYSGGSYGCSYSYTFNDQTGYNGGTGTGTNGYGYNYYKPYQAWNFKYAPFRTTNYTGYGSGTGNGNNGYGGNYCGNIGGGTGVGGVGGYSSSVCISNCPNGNSNQGWYDMPTVVCVEVDRYNSYKLTDCLGKELSSLWHTRGGNYVYYTPGTPTPGTPQPNPTPGGTGTGYAEYTPYPFPSNNEQIAFVLNYGYGTGSGNGNYGYGGYYLTGNVGNPCNANWRVILSHADDATNVPSLVPNTGLYRLYSNVPRTYVNSAHFTTSYNLGFQGGAVGWSNYCGNSFSNIYTKTGSPKVTQMCLLQKSSNLWALTDCASYNTKTYITFGWNGVSWTGWEGSYPIEVRFTTDGWVAGWTGIFNSGMCQYTFDVMFYEVWEPPHIDNGVYDRVFTPMWDFELGNRYEFNYGYGYGNNGNNGNNNGYYDDFTYGNCTDIDPDTVCVFTQRGKHPTESDCAGEPLNFYSWSGYMYETANPYGVGYNGMGDDDMRAYMFIDSHSVTDDYYTSYMVRGGCMWAVNNTRSPTFQGPAVDWGQYSISDSASHEGNCKPGEKYDMVGIYPSGLPWMEYAIQDWATGEILVIMKWDGSTYNGYDNEGNIIHGMMAADNGEQGMVWAGIYGHRGPCMWSITYTFTADRAILPKIKDIPANLDAGWHFTDAYGVWNADIDSGAGTCGDNDDDLGPKYSTLLCIWPNGPAVLNLVQCNDERDDYQTILQQAWWKGGNQQWEGVDYGYSYVWGYKDNNDNQVYAESTFIIQGTGNDGCTFTLKLYRGDDCETSGWKVGISILSVLCALLLVIVLYFITQGGAGGSGSGGYHEYQ